MFLSTFMAVVIAEPAPIRVKVAPQPSYHSVHYFDNRTNLTNRVLDRSLMGDIKDNQTNKNDGTFYEAAAKRQKAAAEEHCRRRLTADNMNHTFCDMTK